MCYIQYISNVKSFVDASHWNFTSHPAVCETPQQTSYTSGPSIFTNTPRCNNFMAHITLMTPNWWPHVILTGLWWRRKGGTPWKIELQRWETLLSESFWTSRRGREGGRDSMEARVRKKERKRGAHWKRETEREKLELFLVTGNDGRAVWGLHGSDPVTTLSRENQVPGHVSLRPSHRHTPALLHVHTHTLSATIHISWSKERERASPQKKQNIIIHFHYCMWTCANYAAYKVPLLPKISQPSMFCLGFSTLPSTYSHSIWSLYEDKSRTSPAELTVKGKSVHFIAPLVGII